MEGIICMIGMILFVVILVITLIINKEHVETTKEYSTLYKIIVTTNDKYKFNDRLNDKLKFNPILKSKRSLDNLDLSQYIANEIKNNKSYYQKLFNSIDSNRTDYNKYIIDYKSIEKYMIEEEFLKINGIKIKYKAFNNCERKIYKSSKLKQPITSLAFICHATYTSPSGRNYYWKDANFSFNELKYFLKQINNLEEYSLREQKEKEKLAEERRSKERKLRELDKIESQLINKENQLAEKESEFKKATKGHIYSAEAKIEENNKVEIDDKETPYQKLKKLKLMLDNGEIIFEEYTKKRNELL